MGRSCLACVAFPIHRSIHPSQRAHTLNPPHTHTQIRNSYKEHGSVFTVNLFTQKMTFLIGPEAAAAFFKATDKELGQDEVYGFMKPVFGEVGALFFLGGGLGFRDWLCGFGLRFRGAEGLPPPVLKQSTPTIPT